ncbi:MAG: membrane or secreted protein [Pirellulales bacterium]|nr:membrane or secreted protein [Pirellulales bacterium]
MRSAALLLGCLLMATVSSGCGGGGGGGSFLNPPSEQQQRATAQRFDPYPENDTGPPILGGRPLGYREPIAEPSRARWNPSTWFNRHGSPQSY